MSRLSPEYVLGILEKGFPKTVFEFTSSGDPARLRDDLVGFQRQYAFKMGSYDSARLDGLLVDATTDIEKKVFIAKPAGSFLLLDPEDERYAVKLGDLLNAIWLEENQLEVLTALDMFEVARHLLATNYGRPEESYSFVVSRGDENLPLLARLMCIKEQHIGPSVWKLSTESFKSAAQAHVYADTVLLFKQRIRRSN